MGRECEVYVWNGDEYILYWEGEGMADALGKMVALKNAGYRCIKLEWRPMPEFETHDENICDIQDCGDK